LLCDFAASFELRGRKEAKDFAHHSVCLIGLEKILSMRRAIQNDEFLWFWSFFVLLLNPGKAWFIAAGILACNDEQWGRLELLGGAIGRAAK
jgi:hypothetical protein